MKKNNSINTIIELLIFLLYCSFISSIESPILSWISGLGIFSYWIVNIYLKLKERRNKDPNKIKFARINDLYNKSTSLTIGIFILISIPLWYFHTKEIGIYQIIGLMAGLLIFINGILYLPSGEIAIDNLHLRNQGSSIHLNQIDFIKISNNSVLLFGSKGATLSQGALDLDDKSKAKIASFLQNHLNLDTDQIAID